jgi:hypothetical protein
VSFTTGTESSNPPLRHRVLLFPDSALEAAKSAPVRRISRVLAAENAQNRILGEFRRDLLRCRMCAKPCLVDAVPPARHASRNGAVVGIESWIAGRVRSRGGLGRRLLVPPSHRAA